MLRYRCLDLNQQVHVCSGLVFRLDVLKFGACFLSQLLSSLQYISFQFDP